ncbi:hypothetical protein EV641_106157 [Rhodococcus sp. SMB37]|nr:hypothetical protein EV641_106157 [Rhodococcus sp. SMB37]
MAAAKELFQFFWRILCVDIVNVEHPDRSAQGVWVCVHVEDWHVEPAPDLRQLCNCMNDLVCVVDID